MDNFVLLKKHSEQLYQYAVKAEKYIYEDCQNACIQMRCYIESLTNILLLHFNLENENRDTLYIKLELCKINNIVQKAILSKLHEIRIVGNKAAHGQDIEFSIAFDLLLDIYYVSYWYCREICQDLTEWPAYQYIHKNNNGSNIVKKDMMLSENHITLSDVCIQDKLSQEQEELVVKLFNFLNNRKENVFLLKGYAGTGKTFLISRLIEYLNAIGRSFVSLAPTGKAAQVLKYKSGSDAFTIHSYIYNFNDIKEFSEIEKNENFNINYTETYKFYAQLKVNNDPSSSVYIIDESSMISDVHNEAEFFTFGSGYVLQDLFKYINLDHNDHNKKIIFVGDAAQLPPVGMNYSPALSEQYLRKNFNVKLTSYELTEIVRQKQDSGILHNSILLRNDIAKNIFNKIEINTSYPDVKSIHYKDLISLYMQECQHQLKNIKNMMMIAYSNADVADYNQEIRQEFFPGKTDLQPKDKIIVVSNNHLFRLYNGELGMVYSINSSPEERTIKLKTKNKDTNERIETSVKLIFLNVTIITKDIKGKIRQISCKIIKNLLDNKNASLNSDENKALYIDFCIRNHGLKPRTATFKDSLINDPYFNALKIKYGYAITCHKAQGSEWETVFIKCEGHKSFLSSDYFRWLYTAITRASSKLYLINPPQIKIGSGLKPVSNFNLSNQPIHHFEPLSTTLDEEKGEKDECNHEDLFGIAKEDYFLRSILSEVRKLLQNTNYKIKDIQHHQYQEGYFFELLNDELPINNLRINISYNAKQKISNIRKISNCSYSQELEKILLPLKYSIYGNPNAALQKNTEFSEDFLNEFHTNIQNICTEHRITIETVDELDWCQKYRFRKGEEIAVFRFWYNGKKQFSKHEVIIKECNSKTLIEEIVILLNQGMN